MDISVYQNKTPKFSEFEAKTKKSGGFENTVSAQRSLNISQYLE